jgi:hypothetical protein
MLKFQSASYPILLASFFAILWHFLLFFPNLFCWQPISLHVSTSFHSPSNKSQFFQPFLTTSDPLLNTRQQTNQYYKSIRKLPPTWIDTRKYDLLIWFFIYQNENLTCLWFMKYPKSTYRNFTRGMIDHFQVSLLAVLQNRHGFLSIIIVKTQIISTNVLGCGDLICQSRFPCNLWKIKDYHVKLLG